MTLSQAKRLPGWARRPSPNVQYTTGRIVGVVTRPVFLFVANNHLPSAVTQGLAVALLASSLSMAGIAADPHRRYYGTYFAEESRPAELTFYTYIASLVVLLALGSAVAFGINLHFSKTFWLAVAGVVYFVSEKIADEVLRLRLFESNFGRWGRSTMLRGMLQLGFLGLLLLVTRGDTSAVTIVIALTTANLIVFGPQVPRPVLSFAFRARLGVSFGLLHRAVRTLFANRLLWTIALLSSGLGYLDRTVALVVDKSRLPVFMLVVMCFSVIQLFVDFFYVSQHRRDFLQHRVTVSDCLTSKPFLLSVSVGLVSASVACAFVLHFSKNGDLFPFGYIVAIAVLQVAIASAIAPREISYWTHKLNRILHVELAFWALFGVCVLIGWRYSLARTGVLLMLAGCAVIRLAMHVFIAHQAEMRMVRAVDAKVAT